MIPQSANYPIADLDKVFITHSHISRESFSRQCCTRFQSSVIHFNNVCLFSRLWILSHRLTCLRNWIDENPQPIFLGVNVRKRLKTYFDGDNRSNAGSRYRYLKLWYNNRQSARRSIVSLEIARARRWADKPAAREDVSIDCGELSPF